MHPALFHDVKTPPLDLFTPNVSLRQPSDSIIPHAGLYLIQIAVLWGPISRTLRRLSAVIICGLAVYVQFHPHFTNDPGQAQPFIVSWSYYLATLEKLLFNENGAPEASFWRIDQPAREALSLSAFSLKKLRWALMLILNQRGIRWNFQVKNVHGMRQSTGRISFVMGRLWEFVYCILTADLMFQLGLRILFTPTEGAAPGAINSRYLTMCHVDPVWQLARCFVFGATPYFMVRAQYTLFSIAAVLLNLSKPVDWPPLFGRLADVTTVRDFWGRFWHQQLRRMLSTYTGWLVDALGFPRGTNWSSYLQLWTAFGVSGLFHARSQLVMPSPENISSAERCDGLFYFFLLQAAAITFEDFVQWLWRGLVAMDSRIQKQPNVISTKLESRLRTLVGYTWTTFVLWYTLPYAGDTLLRMRVGAENMLPFTVWRGLVQRFVPVPPLMINLPV